MKIFTNSESLQGLAWVSTKFTNRSLDHPDIEFHFVSGSPGSDGGRQIRKVSIMLRMYIVTALELATQTCASHVFRSSSLIKSTSSRPVLSLSSHSRFSLTSGRLIVATGTLYTFDIFSLIFHEKLHSLQWRDVTLVSILVTRGLTHPTPCYRLTASATLCGRCTDPWHTGTPGQLSP